MTRNPSWERFCSRCGVRFQPASGNAKYCRDCAPIAYHERHLAQSRMYYATHREILKAKAKEYRKDHSIGFKPKECAVCHQIFRPYNGRQKYCLDCKPSVRREWYRLNSARFRTRHHEAVKVSQREASKRYRERYPFAQILYSAKYRERLKREVFGHYSNGRFVCSCCGESEIDLLTIDHTNNDGAKQRRGLNRNNGFGGIRIYSWLVKNNFPSGFQVLCSNCNMSKGKHGVCVHQTLRFTLCDGTCHF